MMPGAIEIGDHNYQKRASNVAMDRAGIVSTSETGKTLAGVLKNCLKTKETTPIEPGTEFKLYAPDLGLVPEGKLKLVKRGFVKK